MNHIILLLFIFFLCSCQKETPLVRVGANTWPGFEPLYLGRHLGIYHPDEFKLIEYINCMDVNRGFRNNNIDIATLTLDNVLMALEDGYEPVILGIVDFSNGADIIVGDSSIRNLHDLKGKSIGVEPNSVSYYLLIRTLDSANLQLSDVQIHFMQSSQLSEAFKNQQIQIAATYEPYYTEIKKIGARQIINSKAFPNEIIDLIVTRRSFLMKHPDQVQNFMTKWYQITDSIHHSPQSKLSFMAQREGISITEFQESLASLRLPNKLENNAFIQQKQILPYIQKVQKLMYKNKLLKQSNPDLASLLE